MGSCKRVTNLASGTDTVQSSPPRVTKLSPVKVLAVFDGAEQDHAGESVAQQQQEHAHDNKETLVHTDDHRQQKHLEGHL